MEMGLISPGGENPLDFLELRQVLSTYDGDLRDPFCWPQERREELQGRVTIPRVPRCLSPFQGILFSLHCLDFLTEDRLTPRWHVGQPYWKALWESLMGEPRGKGTDPLIHGREA